LRKYPFSGQKYLNIPDPQHWILLLDIQNFQNNLPLLREEDKK
jgi:hypothetical protein